MKPFLIIAKIVVQMLVALFAFDSLVKHFHHSSPKHSSHDNFDIESSQQYYTSEDQAESIQLPKTESPYTSNVIAYTTSTHKVANDQTEHYTFQRKDTESSTSQSVLFLTVTKDGDSWGRNPNENPRTINHYFDLITNTTLDASMTSVGLLTSSKEEFEAYKMAFGSFLASYPFNRVTLVLHPGIKHEVLPTDESQSDRHDRHDDGAQHERRSSIAKLRNYLVATVLRDESHLLWLDSDVYQFSSVNMVETMMNTTVDASLSGGKDVGVLTARCRIGEPWKADAWKADHQVELASHSEVIGDPAIEKLRHDEKENEEWYDAWQHYDLNAWTGPRRKPTEEQLERMYEDRTTWTPENTDGSRTLGYIMFENPDDDLLELDSVGGTVLMIRGDLVRMGLNFATGYLVGATWEHGEGYDGIETEGVCHQSRSMSRDGKSMCYAIGGDWAVWHTVH